MVTTIINILKKNPIIWRVAKEVVFALLALKAWLLVLKHNFYISFGGNSLSAPDAAVPELVISFTSFGKRIKEAHITASSLLRQAHKPQRVILWLAHGEVVSPKLEKLKAQGLEIRFCDDTRSYKKIIPTLQEYPEAIIVTADDDIIYPRNWLQKLYAEHLKAPKDVCCHRAHMLTRKPDGEVEPYNNWLWCVNTAEKPANIFPTGAGGILYPPHSLDPEVLNRAAFEELAPNADDIWLKAMALKNGSVARVVSHKPIRILISTPNTQKNSALRSINIDQGQNDKQFKNVFMRYDLYKLLN